MTMAHSRFLNGLTALFLEGGNQRPLGKDNQGNDNSHKNQYKGAYGSEKFREKEYYNSTYEASGDISV